MTSDKAFVQAPLAPSATPVRGFGALLKPSRNCADTVDTIFGAAGSVSALATDWSRDEEVAAWAHLQPGK